MAKFTVANKETTKQLRTALESALATLEALGVKVEVGAMSFDNNRTMTAKLSVVIQKEGEPEMTSEALEFQRYADMLGLKKEDLGQSFTVRGVGYKISGMSKGKSRMPILATREKDEKTFKFPVYVIQHALGRITDAEAMRRQNGGL